jgi:hypothetical protein
MSSAFILPLTASQSGQGFFRNYQRNRKERGGTFLDPPDLFDLGPHFFDPNRQAAAHQSNLINQTTYLQQLLDFYSTAPPPPKQQPASQARIIPGGHIKTKDAVPQDQINAVIQELKPNKGLVLEQPTLPQHRKYEQFVQMPDS